MYASDYFNITRGDKDDWFDPILNADTQLFVDPFLIFQDGQELWKEAYEHIISHFDHAFTLIAESNFNSNSLAYKKALDLLVFTEPSELCLGYTSVGTHGAGSGRGFARLIAGAIEIAIRRGLEHPKHFEELGILNEGIGADRISDITCTVLKRRLIAYTTEIAERHGLMLQPHKVYASDFDEQRRRWKTGEVMLPTNSFANGPLLLVPERFLRELPALNADDWWNNWENEQLRDDVNYEIMGSVNKATIVRTARENPEAVREWIEKMEGREVSSYDLNRDPLGTYQWSRAAKSYVDSNPIHIQTAQTEEEFLGVIHTVIEQFQLYIEQEGGWYLLWDKGNEEKHEHAAQLIFRGIAEHYCRANNISLDPEVNLGRGPVDFKFSTGHQFRAHLEVKKLHNGKYWNGLEKQLPTYLKSDDGARNGWFVSVRYRDGKKWDERESELPNRVNALRRETGLNLFYETVDARRPESASLL